MYLLCTSGVKVEAMKKLADFIRDKRIRSHDLFKMISKNTLIHMPVDEFITGLKVRNGLINASSSVIKVVNHGMSNVNYIISLNSYKLHMIDVLTWCKTMKDVFEMVKDRQLLIRPFLARVQYIDHWDLPPSD